MKIYKYEIPLKSEFNLKLPSHSQILTFQVQNDKPYIWALIPKLTPERFSNYYFSIQSTGEEFSATKYIGTIQIKDFVWHLFLNNIDGVAQECKEYF